MPTDKRNCPYCKNIVETESHFLIECPLYRHLRCKYFEPNAAENWAELTTSDKLKTLLTIMFKSTSLFVKEAFEIRNSL